MNLREFLDGTPLGAFDRSRFLSNFHTFQRYQRSDLPLDSSKLLHIQQTPTQIFPSLSITGLEIVREVSLIRFRETSGNIFP